MKTASLGRRLGDWLGIVPEDEIPWSTPADLFDLVDAPVELPVKPEIQRAPSRPPATPPAPPVPQTRAPSPVRLGSPIPAPAKNVLTFRQVVNQRRAETQRRSVNTQPRSRW